MNSNTRNPALGDAARQFLASLATAAAKASQQEVHRFVRWYGSDRPVAGLTAPEVANYAERLSVSDKDYARKLERVKAFLLYARDQGWTRGNLSLHLKPKKGKGRAVAGKPGAEAVELTQQGYDELKNQLETLKGKRVDAINEVRKAAADKDFRENAPLEAAREQHGQLMGRIKELEEAMKSAVVMGNKTAVAVKVCVGDRVVLLDLASGEELCYRIVSPRELDPAQGKISTSSPVGKSVLGQEQGNMVEVVTPAGQARYHIIRIER